MKKLTTMVIFLVLSLSLAGCKSPKGGDYPATIMINRTNYYSTDNPVSVEVDKDLMKYTTSYAEDGVPQKDGEENFTQNAGTPYAVLEDGMVVVFIDNQWIEFKTK